MTGFPCTRTGSGQGAVIVSRQFALYALLHVLVLLSQIALVSDASALSGDPTPLGASNAPSTTIPAPSPTLPPAGGIEAAPLPPVQPVQPSLNTPLPAAPQVLPPEPGAPLPPPSEMSAPAAIPAPAMVAGDLGADLWQGSDVSRLMGLVPKLPAPVSIPALGDLQRRLLLTNAPSSGASASVDPLLPARADKLHQMGFNDAALSLGQAISVTGVVDPQEAVEKALMANNTTGACEQVDGIMGRVDAPSLFFRRAVIFCQIMRKQNTPASLGLDLLRERNDQDPSIEDFVALAALANGETKRVPKNIAVPDPLNVALMKTVGMPVPTAISAQILTPVGSGGNVAIARDAARALLERVAAAEQAVKFGLIPPLELGDLYMQMPAGIADPATAISLNDNVELRAQLYQAAYRSGAPGQKARVIDAALKKAQQRGDYLVQAQLYSPFMRDIAPSRELSFFASQAARLLFVTGQADKGSYWLNTVAGNPGAFTRPGEKEGLDLLGRIAGLPGGGDPIANWANASGNANPRIDLLYALMVGLNQPVTSSVVGGFQAAPIVLPGSAAAEIVAAAAGKRRGETIALSLVAIGGDNAIATDPATLGSALRSLTNIGLEADSRRIAREIAVLAGL